MKDGLHLDEAIKKGAVSASGSRIGSPSICCIRECRLVCRFSVAAMREYGRAEAVGDRKAPRHEIAVGDVWRCREHYGDLVAAPGLMSLD